MLSDMVRTYCIYSSVQRKVQSYMQVMCTCVNPHVPYACLRVISADVVCIPAFIIELFAAWYCNTCDLKQF